MLAVVGARGGAGASTVAAALARVGGPRTATVLVDLVPDGAGVDLLVGVEDDAGVRWPDLAGARGALDGDELVALLPRWGPVAVLSADHRRPGLPSPAVVVAALEGLAAVHGLVVLDVGRDALVPVAPRCDAVVLVVPQDLAGVAGALAVLARLADAGAPGVDVLLVTRGPAPGGLGVAEVETALGLRAAARLPHRRSVARAGERGAVGLGGPAARVARRLLDGRSR
ncbi:helicase/secretion neighborhood CpaE-like protein [Cellulomonas marina]|uniref:Helicase/secretion neighborhood CpaE-like protein n=1 Tax=Cellulomonas marina TaxID=988821 RepID=A0A1I0XGE1_9CELL|nr:helicase/secretion neighborhood CpaE-like protein [Cellulomonas marina]